MAQPRSSGHTAVRRRVLFQIRGGLSMDRTRDARGPGRRGRYLFAVPGRVALAARPKSIRAWIEWLGIGAALSVVLRELRLLSSDAARPRIPADVSAHRLGSGAGGAL